MRVSPLLVMLSVASCGGSDGQDADEQEPCTFESLVDGLVTEDTLDCGTFTSTLLSELDPEIAAMAQQCVVDAKAEGTPFVLIHAASGVDSTSTTAYVWPGGAAKVVVVRPWSALVTDARSAHQTCLNLSAGTCRPSGFDFCLVCDGASVVSYCGDA
jgi:hypothetical protein